MLRIGTLVVACSVVCLVDVGPGTDSESNWRYLFAQPEAIVSFALMGAFMLLGLYGAIYTRSRGTDDMIKIISFATIQASTLSISLSIVKVCDDVTGWHAVIVWGLYIAVVGANFSTATIAAGVTDISIYFPIFCMLKLLFNDMILGLLVWEEWHGLHDKWMAYLMVHVLVVLGSSLMSPVELSGLLGLKLLEEAGGADVTATDHPLVMASVQASWVTAQAPGRIPFSAGADAHIQLLIEQWEDEPNEEIPLQTLKKILIEGFKNGILDEWTLKDYALQLFCDLERRGFYKPRG